MDCELEQIFSEWEFLENENQKYHQKKKDMAMYLILIFLNLMAYSMRFIVDYLNNQKKKIDKQYYSVDELD